MKPDPVGIVDYAGPRPASHRPTHAVIVVISGIASSGLIFFTAITFGSIRGVELFVMGMVPVAFFSLLALAIALIKSTSGRPFKIFLALLCLAPSLFILANFITQEVKFRINGPSDRFRDYVSNPIPASVTSLKFVEMVDTVDPVLVLRFNISPADLDRLIRDEGYVRVSPGTLRNPTDRFNAANYLRLGSDDELYQHGNQDGDEFTLRVNKEHSAAFFRQESSFEYRK